MSPGNDTDIWPLSLDVIKRVCWNNDRTLSEGSLWTWAMVGSVTGGPALDMAFIGMKSGGSEAKGEKGEMRTTGWSGTVKSLVGLGSNLVRAGDPRGSHSTLSDPLWRPAGIWRRQAPNTQTSNYFSLLFFHVYMCVLSCICPSLVQHPHPPTAPSFHGGILGTAARA